MDAKVELGEVPKQLANLKQQYDRLLKKYREKQLEQKDLEGEHVDEKLDYLEALREQRRETKLMSKILPRLIASEDIDKLRVKSTWDDSTNSFSTPGFLLRNKHITMPKMPKKESKLRIIQLEEFGNRFMKVEDSNSQKTIQQTMMSQMTTCMKIKEVTRGKVSVVSLEQVNLTAAVEMCLNYFERTMIYRTSQSLEICSKRWTSTMLEGQLRTGTSKDRLRR